MARNRTRAVRWLLKKLGYDLRRLEKFRVHAWDPESTLGQEPGLDSFEAVIPRPVRHFDIMFRSCARVEIFGQSRKRLLDASKTEVLARCLNSLVRSINHAMPECEGVAITLKVFDDHSDPACIERMQAILAGCACPTELIHLEVTGNGPSIGEVYRHAKVHATDVIYLVEDDYLHDVPAVREMIESYARLADLFGGDIVLFPSDRPGTYRHVEPTQLLLGSHRHWRRLGRTTFTSVTSANLLNRYWERYIALAQYGIDPDVTEATTIHPIYEEVPCLAPVPSLAVHFQQLDEISPFVDWRQWWADAAPEGEAAPSR
jgi:hypothetical protein